MRFLLHIPCIFLQRQRFVQLQLSSICADLSGFRNEFTIIIHETKGGLEKSVSLCSPSEKLLLCIRRCLFLKTLVALSLLLVFADDSDKKASQRHCYPEIISIHVCFVKILLRKANRKRLPSNRMSSKLLVLPLYKKRFVTYL